MRKPSIARRVTDECTDLKASDSVLALEPSPWIQGLNLEIRNKSRKYSEKMYLDDIGFVLIDSITNTETNPLIPTITAFSEDGSY